MFSYWLYSFKELVRSQGECYNTTTRMGEDLKTHKVQLSTSCTCSNVEVVFKARVELKRYNTYLKEV